MVLRSSLTSFDRRVFLRGVVWSELLKHFSEMIKWKWNFFTIINSIPFYSGVLVRICGSDVKIIWLNCGVSVVWWLSRPPHTRKVAGSSPARNSLRPKVIVFLHQVWWIINLKAYARLSIVFFLSSYLILITFLWLPFSAGLGIFNYIPLFLL